jgi:cation/acetate symporter
MVGLLMIVFSTLGGMRAATWVQIIKAILMIGGSAMIATLVLIRFGFNVSELLKTAASNHPNGTEIMDIRGFSQDAIATLSLGVGVLFGIAGLPHILMRFFTVNDERAAPSIGFLRDVPHWPVLCDAVCHWIWQYRTPPRRCHLC